MDDQRSGDASGIVSPAHGMWPRALDATGSWAYVRAYDQYMPAVVSKQGGGPRFARELVQTVALAFLMFFASRAVVQGYEVEGPSMQPTYHTGQRVFVNKALYARLDFVSRWVPFLGSPDARFLFHPPQRGEVAVFDPPFRSDAALIKRVIGVPGDHVAVRNGSVYVNDQKLEEPYLTAGRTMCGTEWCDVTLGPDQYFVMGDNRANSSDSRFWGPVSGDHFIGRPWLIFRPLSEFGQAP